MDGYTAEDYGVPQLELCAVVAEALVDLRSELADAERNNDIGAASKLRGEIEDLGQELARSFGPRKGNRTAHETVEKMRKAVLGAIRNALRDLDNAHAAAGRHLQNSLITGVFCVYRPERPVSWRVETDWSADGATLAMKGSAHAT